MATQTTDAVWTVADAIAELQKLPPTAEMRVTEATDPEQRINKPASRVRFDLIGPLLYAEII